jgi:hypothetical protein
MLDMKRRSLSSKKSYSIRTLQIEEVRYFQMIQNLKVNLDKVMMIKSFRLYQTNPMPKEVILMQMVK